MTMFPYLLHVDVPPILLARADEVIE